MAPCPRCDARSDEGGWCGCCGQDLRPGSVAGRFSAVAQARAAAWAADPDAAREGYESRGGDSGAPPPLQVDAPAGTKTCPRCAEDVKAAAEVCRYCGHEFGAPAPVKKVWGTAAPTSGLAVGAYNASREGDVWGALRLAKEAEAEIRGGEVGGGHYVQEARDRAYTQIAVMVACVIVGVVVLLTQL